MKTTDEENLESPQSMSSDIKIPEGDQHFEDGVVDVRVIAFKQSFVLVAYSNVWRSLLALSICLHCWLVVYDVAFMEGEMLLYMFIMDGFFITDFIMSALFNRWNEPNLTVHVRRHTVAMLLDFVTIPPYELILDYRGEIVRLVRFYRVVLYFSKERRKIQRLRVFLCMFEVTLYLVLATQAAAGLLYALNCKKKGDTNCQTWLLDRITEREWKNPQVVEHYVMCLFYTAYQVTRKGIRLSADDFVFQVVSGLCMMTYFAVVICLGVSYVTSAMTQRKFNLFTVSQKRSALWVAVTRRGNRPHLFEVAMRYAAEFWRQRSATQEAQDLSLLPSPMRRELLLDLYWPLLRHSQLFRGLELPLMREAAQAMRSEFLPAGQRLLARGQPKDRLVYVASGVVQVMLEEDDETPLLTLGEGTVLGTASLLFSCPSRCDVVSATSCVVYSLDQREFQRLAEPCPALCRKLVRLLTARIAEAERLGAVLQRLREGAVSLVDRPPKKCIKWMVKTAAKIRESGTGDSRAKKISHYNLQEVQFTAKNLDEYAILTDLAGITNKLCLRLRCPCVLKPDTALLLAWNLLLSGLVMAVAFATPYKACIDCDFSDAMWTLVVVVQLGLLLDVWVIASTSVRSSHGFLTQVGAIVRRRLSTFTFYVDILVALPVFMLFTLELGRHTQQHVYLATMLQIVKMWRIVQLAFEFQHTALCAFPLIRYVFPFLYLIYPVYLLSNIAYYIACPSLECRPDSWVAHRVNERANSIGGPFLNAISFICMCATSLAKDAIKPVSIREHIFIIVIGFFFCLLFLYIVTDLTSSMIVDSIRKSRYEDIRKTVATFGKNTGIDPSLTYRLLRQLDCLYKYSDGHLKIFEYSQIAFLPNYINNEIFLNSVYDVLKTASVINLLDDEIIRKISSFTRQFVLPPNEIIIGAGRYSKKIYIIENGWCETTHWYTKTRQLFNNRNPFPLVECLLGHPNFRTIKTETTCKLLAFSVADFRKIMSEHKEAEKDIYDALYVNFDTQTTNLVIKQKSKLELAGFVVPAEVRKSFYSFGPPWRRKREYLEAVERRRFRRIASLFPGIVILPHGKFMIAWELSRIVLAVVTSLVVPISRIVRFYYWPNCVYYLWILDATAALDILVRFHIAYYLDNGVLVTHPFKTYVHYLTHSFAFDLLAFLPFNYFSADLMYSPRTLSLFEILAFLNRCLQIYRIRQLKTIMNALRIETCGMIPVITGTIVLFVITSALSLFYVYLYCEFKETGLECKAGTLLTSATSDYSPFMSYLYAFFACASVLTATGMEFSVKSLGEMEGRVVLVVVGYIARITFYAVAAASLSAQNITQTDQQRKMGDLLKFTNSKRIPRVIKRALVTHFELLWRRWKGNGLPILDRRHHPTLIYDVLEALFAQQLRSCRLFADSDAVTVRHFLRYTDPRVHVRRSRICRVNDVISSLYVVVKGNVQVLAPNGSQLVRMGIGGVFGNLERTANSRQTVTVIADGHVEVLRLKTVAFIAFLDDFKNIRETFDDLVAMHTDYILPTEQPEGAADAGRSALGMTAPAGCAEKVLLAFYPRALFTRVFEKFIVGLALFTFTITVYQLGMQEDSSGFIALAYIVDLIHVFEIFFKFHRPYIDVYGHTESNRGLIAWKYVRSWELYVDILALIPIDVIFAVGRNYFWMSLCRMNRALRLIYYFRFIRAQNEKLNVNIIAIQDMNIFSVVFLILHTWSCSRCYLMAYYVPNFTSKLFTYGAEDEGWNPKKRFMFYVHLLQLSLCFLTNGPVEDLTIVEAVSIYYFIVSCFVFNALQAVCIGWACALVNAGSRKFDVYARTVKKIHDYLKIHHVSEALRRGARTYLCLLWEKRRGQQEPELLAEAPRQLHEAVKNFLYGFRMRKHPLFSGCHSDLLRQIIDKAFQCTYFPENYVIFSGDTDGCMYLVHFGEVEVLEDGPRGMQEFRETLHEGDLFGILQGVWPERPHRYSYRARTMCVVLTLRHSDWFYLLDFFPASKADVMERAKSLFDV